MNSGRTGLAITQRQFAQFAQAFGIIAYAGVQWLVLLRLLPLGGYPLVGSYALAQAMIAPIIGFFAFSLRPLWVSGAMGELSAGSVLAIRIKMGVAALIVAGIIMLLVEVRIDTAILIYVLASKFLDTVSDILSAIFDRQRKSATCGLLITSKSALMCLVILAGWMVQLGLIITLFTLFIAQAIAVVAEWKLCGSPFPSGLTKISGTLAIIPQSTALFAAINSLVASISGFLPRYFLEVFADREAVGYFSTIYIPVLMIQMVATGLSQTNLHRLSRITRNGNIRETLVASAPVALLIVGLHAAVTACAFLVASVAEPQWGMSGQLLSDLAIVLALSLPVGLRQFYSYLVMSSGRMTAVFLSSLFLLLVQVILAPWAIQIGGIYGCVILVSIGALLQIATSFWILDYPN